MKFLLDKLMRFAYNPLTEKPVSGRAQVAQSVEQTIENRRVAGSIPALGTIFSLKFRYMHGGFASVIF